jgi:hypothetical protein
MAKISLNLNQNTKHEYEMCKKKIQVQNFILITCETWIWNEQGYVAKLYFKPILNKVKIMGSHAFKFIPFWELNSSKFH